MDKDLVARKLDSLARCLARIEAKRPATSAEQAGDLDCQDILSVNLERGVPLCVVLGAHQLADTDTPPPETMGDVFRILASQGRIDEPVASALRKAVGFRNLSVHAYDRVDWDRVHDIVHHRLDDFRAFASHVISLAASD
jgi:uncharacterized protein YutE (UPF0331/DUF86 family)